MGLWENPSDYVERFLRNDPEDADWEYRNEYLNTLLQGYRSLQAYQTQRFILQKDIITNSEFVEAFSNNYVETAKSISLSHIIDMITTLPEATDICFIGDVSFQHVFQFSQGCPTCALRYYSAAKTEHVSNYGDIVKRLQTFMHDPSLLVTSTIGNCIFYGIIFACSCVHIILQCSCVLNFYII